MAARPCGPQRRPSTALRARSRTSRPGMLRWPPTQSKIQHRRLEQMRQAQDRVTQIPPRLRRPRLSHPVLHQRRRSQGQWRPLSNRIQAWGILHKTTLFQGAQLVTTAAAVAPWTSTRTWSATKSSSGLSRRTLRLTSARFAARATTGMSKRNRPPGGVFLVVCKSVVTCPSFPPFSKVCPCERFTSHNTL